MSSVHQDPDATTAVTGAVPVTVTVRIWLPDRPGALGRVASTIGAVGGDVIGIEILERGAGRAIDELVVSLPDESLMELMVSEIVSHVDGVDVEDVRRLRGPAHDRWLDPLETAARLAEADDAVTVHRLLCEEVADDLDADWAVVLDPVHGRIRRTVGEAPSAAWLAAFVEGTRLSAAVSAGAAGPDDVAWATLPGTGLDLVLGRRGRPLRLRERRQLAVLARIGAARLATVAPTELDGSPLDAPVEVHEGGGRVTTPTAG